MCGLIGFVSTGGTVDLEYLHQLAALAERRGPHAFGFAWKTKHVEEPKLFKMPRPYSTASEKLNLAASALSLIGHARLGTSGDIDKPEDCQPLHVGPILLAHNGTVSNFRDIALQRKLQLNTGCDSELLGQLIVGFTGSLQYRIERAIKEVGGEQPHALLVMTYTKSLIAFRRGHPLYEARRAEGIYLCSWPPDGSAKLLPEGRAVAF